MMPDPNAIFWADVPLKTVIVQESEQVFHLCPVCEGEAEGCTWCDDSGCPGYVEHDCG